MQIIDYFKYCSWKFAKENDLSDITWAMCMSSEVFRDSFLLFFFPNMVIEKDILIEREKSADDSRPDFYINNGGVTYLIENKINDRNHHFGQYDVAFHVTPEKFGYITNYKIYEKEIIDKKYPLRTWEELYDRFSERIPEETEEKFLWEGYLEYVKNVCGIIKIDKPMKLEGLYSLFSLIEILEKKLCDRDTDEFRVKKYNMNICGNGGIKNGVIGINFELTYKNIQVDTFWGWIGIYYNREQPTICMGFYNNPGWGKLYIELIKPYEKEWCCGKTFDRPYFDSSCLWFDMNRCFHDIFENSDQVINQEAILTQFMDEVLLFPILLRGR